MTFSNAVHTLTVPDYAVMRRMNRWRPPRWLRWWMLVFTRGGDGWFWMLGGCAVLASHDAAKCAAWPVAGVLLVSSLTVGPSYCLPINFRSGPDIH